MRLLVLVAVISVSSLALRLTPRCPEGGCRVRAGQMGAANCTTNWFTQTVDHFSWKAPPVGDGTYQQRFLTYDKYWRPHSNGQSGPIFFYTGNEGDVTLYANATGLMWEHAEEFGAYIIFAEHRYYGSSQPFGADTMQYMQYLTHEQALADYATLLFSLKNQLNATGSPVVAFGGSYGGMLSAWFRIKYPSAVVGSIAASAPVLAFRGETPAWDSSTYYSVITRNAGPLGGAPQACQDNIIKLWPWLFSLTPADYPRVASAFQLCSVPQNASDIQALAFYIRDAWDTLSMGNYPYPSSYLTGGAVDLPAWPVRLSCSFLAAPLEEWDLLAAVAQAAAVLYNATKNVPCNDQGPNPYTDPSTPVDGIWDYQFCTEMMPDSFWFTSNGQTDMFWNQPYNATFINEHCAAAEGVQPRPDWITVSNGAPTFPGASNIIFSSGMYDPWSSAGVKVSPSHSLVVVNITEGGHHLDLYFSNPADPKSVRDARKLEMQHAKKWIDDFYGH